MAIVLFLLQPPRSHTAHGPIVSDSSTMDAHYQRPITLTYHSGFALFFEGMSALQSNSFSERIDLFTSTLEAWDALTDDWKTYFQAKAEELSENNALTAETAEFEVKRYYLSRMLGEPEMDSVDHDGDISLASIDSLDCTYASSVESDTAEMETTSGVQPLVAASTGVAPPEVEPDHVVGSEARAAVPGHSNELRLVPRTRTPLDIEPAPVLPSFSRRFSRVVARHPVSHVQRRPYQTAAARSSSFSTTPRRLVPSSTRPRTQARQMIEHTSGHSRVSSVAQTRERLSDYRQSPYPAPSRRDPQPATRVVAELAEESSSDERSETLEELYYRYGLDAEYSEFELVDFDKYN